MGTWNAHVFGQIFLSARLRVYTSSDVIGTEVGGALKNVIAIGAGVCTGMGLGLNSMAMLITRGTSEMMRLALCMGAQPVRGTAFFRFCTAHSPAAEHVGRSRRHGGFDADLLWTSEP